MNIQECMMSGHGWCKKAYLPWRRIPPSQPLLYHTALSILLTFWLYNNAAVPVQRKTSVSAATIIWGVFGPGGGRLSIAECYVPRKHGWNLAAGQMGILSLRGGWNVFCVGGSVMCWWDEGGRGEPVPNFPQLSLGERCICDVNMQGADKNMHLTQIINLSWTRNWSFKFEFAGINELKVLQCDKVSRSLKTYKLKTIKL